jgi:hypothetical protein
MVASMFSGLAVLGGTGYYEGSPTRLLAGVEGFKQGETNSAPA